MNGEYNIFWFVLIAVSVEEVGAETDSWNSGRHIPDAGKTRVNRK